MSFILTSVHSPKTYYTVLLRRHKPVEKVAGDPINQRKIEWRYC